MGHVQAPDIPPPYRRYTLYYVHRICIDKRFDDWIPRWEKIDFKTLREAREYLTIAGENAYIIDNVTNKIIKSNNDKGRNAE